MIISAGHIKKNLPLVWLGVVPFTILLNWIIFGSQYFTFWQTGLAGTLVSLLVMTAVFMVCLRIIGLLRNRFPSDEDFIKRVLIQVMVFLLLSALVLVALFSIYRLMGLIDSMYENKFTWAFIATGLICIFLSFLNEALNVLERWKTGLKETEQLKRNYKQGQLMGLKSQINPHVLFNSLNSLSGLIQEDTDQAEKFLDEMSKVYRYMLRNEEEPLVPLQTELQFIQSYFSLLKARYNEAIAYEIDLWQEDLEKQIPPLSLQVIVENAIFQNRISRDSPLIIRIASVRGGALVVSNNIQRKLMTEPFDYEAGVDNLVKKYQLMNQPPIEIKEEEGLRKIRLPFITQTEEVA